MALNASSVALLRCNERRSIRSAETNGKTAPGTTRRPPATRAGYRIDRSTRIQIEGFNLANRQSSAIDYYYESRLRGEAEGVEVIHFHPIEPRSFRLTLTKNFN